MESVSLSHSCDKWICDLSGDGEFPVKEVRNFLDNLFLPSYADATRWVKYIPIKINVFVWRAQRDFLPTRVNLSRRGILLESSSCPLCLSSEENIHHGSELGASEDTNRIVNKYCLQKSNKLLYKISSKENIEEFYKISEATRCVIIAKVFRIVSDEGWYYMVCIRRKIKANKLQTANSYNCERCDEEVSDVYPRIKVQIRMQDETRSASFWLFQQEICKLIDKSPGYLISKAKK
nr:RNA-directed DNA polymerase, eukaryota [Tanacetum cinerariifolium]